MLWVYTITDSNLRMGTMESFLSFLKSLGYEARIQNIYYQECIYIAYAPSSSAIFKPGDNIYFIVDSDVGWASFNNNFSCAVWNRVDKAQYHEWCKQRIYKKFREKTMQFKNLNVGDIFKIPNRDFLYIKVLPIDTGHCKWPAVILTGERKGYPINLGPELEVKLVRDLNDIPADCCKGVSLKELANKYLKDDKDSFMTYGGVDYNKIANSVFNYSSADVKNTLKFLELCQDYKRISGPCVKKVIFNDPATIVIWGDGSKTVVKAQKGEKFDKEKGIALCYMKKMLGNQGNFNNVFREWIKPEPTGFYDMKHPGLGIQDISPKNKKEFPSNIVRIKTSNLSIISTYMQEMRLTVNYIAKASGLSTQTVKRALTGSPVLKTSILKICGYFDFPIETTRYVED